MVNHGPHREYGMLQSEKVQGNKKKKVAHSKINCNNNIILGPYKDWGDFLKKNVECCTIGCRQAAEFEWSHIRCKVASIAVFVAYKCAPGLRTIVTGELPM